MNFGLFLNQSEVKLIVAFPHAFFRVWRRLHFASSSDWYVALFRSVVIVQSNYFFNWFGFDFKTLNWKPL